MGGVAIHLDKDSATYHHPVHIVCKIRVDPELVLLCQEMGQQPLRGSPIGKMMGLYPFDLLKNQAMDEAKTFTGHMRRMGNRPLQAESEMEIWGPYREKLKLAKGLVNIEEGNHTLPEGRWAFGDYSGWTHDGQQGPRQIKREEVLDSPDWKNGVIFLIRGRFEATRGKQEETTGTVLV